MRQNEPSAKCIGKQESRKADRGRISRAKKQREKTMERETKGERRKMCETFNRRVAGSPEEYPAEREALEKPVGANLFYFEYKVGDEIFPAAVKTCVVDESVRTGLGAHAAGRNFLINSLCANYIFSVSSFNVLTSTRDDERFFHGGSTRNRIF